MSSQQLNSLQILAINKLGNIMCPENGEFVKFSDTGAAQHVDILLNELPEQDLADLKLLLMVLGLLPSFVLKFILNLLENNRDLNGEIGTLIRMVRLGLRGIVFSLYYSRIQNTDLVGFKIQLNKN